MRLGKDPLHPARFNPPQTLSNDGLMTDSERIAALEAQVARLVTVLSGRSELSRISELGVAVDGVVDRMEGISGGTRVKDYIDARFASLPAPTSTDPTVIKSLDARLKAVEARPVSVVQVPVVPLPDGSNPTVREVHLKTSTGETQLVQSENDRGFGINYNCNFSGGGWRPGSSHVDPRLGQIQTRDEQDNVHSLKFAPPDLDPNPNTSDEFVPGEYDGRLGKTFVWRSMDDHGHATRQAEFGGGEVGRVLDLVAVASNGKPSTPSGYRLRVDPDSGVYEVAPDGTERRVKTE